VNGNISKDDVYQIKTILAAAGAAMFWSGGGRNVGGSPESTCCRE